ncbi:EamA family transporter [Paracoccus sp. S-4012]|uniref:DMT family transporter n=1 Tax=Paracoccus sp. S-4012 TaxID=2665648 RepID=UPI0012AFC06D|nr:DMT family transporter [Paracoccus sp. S-4012]MRX50967.1 EamA family transporter [Paracoccus sp. S-4012]
MTAADRDLTGPLTDPALQRPAVPPPEAEPQKPARNRRGILLMCVVSLVFAIQDSLSRELGSEYSPFLVVMLRYWFMVIFVSVIVSRAPGGFRAAARSRRPWLQIARALLLIADIVLAIFAFVRLGLVNAHAIMASYPLMIVALSGPILGERIGWRRWTAVGVGFMGMMIVLRPGSGAMSPDMLFALGAAATFALYGVLTRLASRHDPSTVSFFWTSIGGAAAITLVGLMHWEALAPADWLLLAALCLCAATSHWLLILAYEMAEASVLQPFAYTQLMWIVIIGTVFYSERLAPNVVVGVTIIVGAGLFSLWRARMRAG